MVRCPGCGNENPPEYPPDEYPFCIECGTQLGHFRPPHDQGGGHPQQGGYPQGGYPQQGGAPQGGYPQGGYPQGGHPPEQYPQQPWGQQPYGQGQYQQDQWGQSPYGQDQYQQDPYGPHRADTPYLQHGPLAGSARLVLESGAGNVEYPLDAPEVTIGRSRSNTISLEDARVSRNHARIVRNERGYFVEDLNSRNGTRVDDRAVRESTLLTDGAVVRIGDSVFRFSMTAPAQAPPPGPAPAPYGGGPGGPGSPVGPGGPGVPEIYVAPWNPVQCPTCQGIKTMRPIVYGPAAQTPGAQTAARRGEVALGDGPPRPDAPNAECRACGTRVRIINTGG